MLSANKAGDRPINAKDFINRDIVTIVVILIFLTGKFGFLHPWSFDDFYFETVQIQLILWIPLVGDDEVISLNGDAFYENILNISFQIGIVFHRIDLTAPD